MQQEIRNSNGTIRRTHVSATPFNPPRLATTTVAPITALDPPASFMPNNITEKLSGYMRTSQPVWVPLDQIELTSYNPPNRVEEGYLKSLRKVIESEGGILNPIHLVRLPSGKWCPADGNRRFTIAKEKGLTRIQAHCYTSDEMDPMDLVNRLFHTLNDGTKSFNPAAKLTAHLLGGPAMTKTIENTRTELLAIVSESEIQTLITKHRQLSPDTVKRAYAAACYCLGVDVKRKDVLRSLGGFELARKTYFWLLNNDVSQHTKDYIARGLNPDALHRAILNNQSYVPRIGNVPSRAKKEE